MASTGPPARLIVRGPDILAGVVDAPGGASPSIWSCIAPRPTAMVDPSGRGELEQEQADPAAGAQNGQPPAGLSASRDRTERAVPPASSVAAASTNEVPTLIGAT